MGSARRRLIKGCRNVENENRTSRCRFSCSYPRHEVLPCVSVLHREAMWGRANSAIAGYAERHREHRMFMARQSFRRLRSRFVQPKFSGPFASTEVIRNRRARGNDLWLFADINTLILFLQECPDNVKDEQRYRNTKFPFCQAS